MKNERKMLIIITLILSIIVISNCEMPNLFCNSDFENYVHATTIDPFYYFYHRYKVWWFERDQCWYAKSGVLGNKVEVEQIFTNPEGVPIYSRAAQLNSMAPFNPYWLCQDKILQKRRYYNYTFQIGLHPISAQATAYAYINSKQVNRTTVNCSVYPNWTTITHISQTTQKINSFCSTIHNQTWRHDDYSPVGLASFLDNFQLRKLPQEVYTLNFQVKLNQVQNKIQFTADASCLNSTLVDYVLNNSIILANQAEWSQVKFQIIGGKYLHGIAIINSFMVIYELQYQIKAWLIGGDHQIAFDVFMEFIPPTKLFFPLKQSELDTYNSISNFGQSFITMILDIFNKFKIFSCSFLFANLINSFGAFVLYNFLNLSAQPTQSYLGMQRISSSFLRNNEDIFESLRNFFSKIGIDFNRDFGGLQGEVSFKVEKIPEKVNGFYWFGSYGIYGNFLKNNIVDIILFAFLLLKVGVICFLAKKIPYLSEKLPKISNIQIYKLFIMEIVSCSIFMIISAFSNIAFQGQTNKNQQFNLILHIKLFGIILAMPFVYCLMVRSQLNKNSVNLSKHKAKSQQEQKTKNNVKWETNFQVLQFLCCFLVPASIILQSILGTVVTFSVFLVVLYGCLFVGWTHLSIQFRILKSMFLLIFTVHHLAYSYLGIISIAIDNRKQITETVGYWCNIAGMTILITTIALGIILLLEIVIFIFFFILKPLLLRLLSLNAESKSKNKVQNLQNRNIFDEEAESRNPTIKYLNDPTQKTPRPNVQNQNKPKSRMGRKLKQ